MRERERERKQKKRKRKTEGERDGKKNKDTRLDKPQNSSTLCIMPADQSCILYKNICIYMYGIYITIYMCIYIYTALVL